MLSMIYIGALLTTPVMAQRHKMEVLRNLICDNVRRAAQVNWLSKQLGRPMRTTVPSGSENIAPLYRWAFDYGYNQATSEEDAVMMARAKCMDNVDRLVQDDIAGRTVAPLR